MDESGNGRTVMESQNFMSGRIRWVLAAGLAVLILFGALLSWWFSSTRTKGQIDMTGGTRDGFSFMSVGAVTRQNRALLERLQNHLGSVAVETRSVIDLEKTYNGFLNRHLPELWRFHQALNDATGARVEHDTTRWMFRYANSRNMPFRYVEFIFSNESGHPLYIHVIARKEGSGVLDVMEERHGPGRQISWQDVPGSSRIWENDRELFLTSTIEDRFGNPEYHIVIYFKHNISVLIEQEKAAAARRIEAKEKAAGSAFN